MRANERESQQTKLRLIGNHLSYFLILFCLPKMPRLSLKVKSKTIQLFKEKWPVSYVIDLTEVPKSTVYYLLSKYKRYGAVTDGRSTGRPGKLT